MTGRLAIAGLFAISLTDCRPRRNHDFSATDAAPAVRGQLVAQRTAELHYQFVDGPLVGLVHAGVVQDVRPADNTHVRVTVPAAWSDSKRVEDFLIADSDAFGSTPKPVDAIAYPPDSRVVRDVAPLALLPAKDATKPYLSTIGGELHVLTPPGTSPAQVTQLHAGLELRGWVDEAKITPSGKRLAARYITRHDGKLVLHGGATAADEREIDAIPADFVRPDAVTTSDAVKKLLDAGKPIYWLVANDAGHVECRSHVFVPETYAVAKSILVVKCAAEGYWVIGERDGTLRMSTLPTHEPTLAWHPDDEEHWFTTSAACEIARAPADRALQKDRNAVPPGGIHYTLCGE